MNELRRATGRLGSTTLLSLLAFTMVLAWMPAAAVAAPLGLQPGFPEVNTIGLGTASYDAGSGALTVTVTPKDVILPPVPPGVDELIAGPKSWTIMINVDNTGAPNLGVATPTDLVITGTADGVNTGTLLTGSLSAFGFIDTTTHRWDFTFHVTGGTLAGYFGGQDVGVLVHLQTSFGNTFTASYSGVAQDAVSGPVSNCSIGDFVWNDLNGNGIQDPGEPGLDGVTVQLRDTVTNAVVGTTTTGVGPLGQHGYYQFFGLCGTPHPLQVEVVTPTGFSPTLVGAPGSTPANDSNASPSPVTLLRFQQENEIFFTNQTLDFGFVSACTGSIGDYVWHDTTRNGLQDGSEVGINGVSINLHSGGLGGPVVATTTTSNGPGGGAGYYQFTGLCAGDYTVEVNGATLPAGFTPTASNVGPDRTIDSNGSPAAVTLATGSTSDQTIDFGYLSACTGVIGDFVWHDDNRNGEQDAGELGLDGVRVMLFDGSMTLVGDTFTTTVGSLHGQYQFTGLCAGTYTVVVDTTSAPLAGMSPTTGPEAPNSPIDSNGSPASVTLPDDNTTNLTIDFGYVSPCLGRIGDFVWNDLNGNGIQDAGEPGIGGVTVNLRRASDNSLLQTTTTLPDGSYGFVGLCGGDYLVEVIPPPGYFATTTNAPGSNTGNDSNPNPSAVTLTDGPGGTSSDFTIDFGFIQIVRAIHLDKTASPTTYSAVGQVITYTYVITNTGNVTLAGPFTITDDKQGTITPCGSGPLAPGGSTSCTSTHTITQGDLDDGSITNVATASGNGLTSNQATATVTGTQTPSISLTKTPAPTTYSAVGQIITYTYVITNTGNTTLAGPFTITDDKQGTITPCGSGPLAPGGSTSCTSTHTITQADLDAGSITNVATATGNGLTSNQATATVTGTQTKSISLTKTANPTTYLAVGQVITYTYVITNTGNVTLAGPFTITDDKQGTITPCGSGPLAPGASTSCTSTHTITQADLNAGSITNVATATGNGLTSNQATATVTGTQNKGISLTKTPSPTTYSAVGQVITYTYVITNTGNVTLAGPFTITDDKQGIISPCGSGPLAPGASTSCTATHTITQADLDAGSITNIATATGNGLTSNQATATVTGMQTKSISLTKTANPTTYSAVGQVITYTYVIRNTGNVTLAGPFTINDNKLGIISPCGSGPLAPGATTSCTATHTITQADLDAGSITNVATASGNGLTSNQATATVTGTQTKSISLTKSASPTTYTTAGQVITYTYVIRNTGNVTLAGPFTITDNKIGTITPCGSGPLAPGASTSCTAPYTITAADVTARSVTNVATASGNGVTSNQATTTVTARTPLTLLCPAGSGTVGVPYSSSAVASGGTAPYTFAVASGALPAGLSLNTSTGAITGTPTTAGSFSFTIRVTDSTGATAISSCVGTCAGGATTWNFNLPTGVLGAMQTYTVNGIPITAYGFSNAGAPKNLYGKNAGGDENGLGIAGTSADNEIDTNNFIQLDLRNVITAGATTASMIIGSVQAGESYNLYGSNTLGSIGTLLAFNRTADNTPFSIPGFPTYRYVSVRAASHDVLLGAVSFTLPAGCIITIGRALPVETTYTQGGWGAKPSGNNPGTILKNNFSSVYPGGYVQIGGTKYLRFTSAGAIEAFLPAGSTPGVLTASATNPTSSSAGVFAGQVLALRLNVDFSNAGVTRTGLAGLHVASGPLAGYTVSQVLALANTVLGGNTGALPAGLTVSSLNNIVDQINQNFDNGTSNNGYLIF